MIGVHAPEFAFERDLRNVEREVEDLGIAYPVAVDNDYALWRAFANQYWPAHYFIDAQGNIRHTHFGEGEYDRSERVIQQLLAEAGSAPATTDLVDPTARAPRSRPIEFSAEARDLRRPCARRELRVAGRPELRASRTTTRCRRGSG